MYVKCIHDYVLFSPTTDVAGFNQQRRWRAVRSTTSSCRCSCWRPLPPAAWPSSSTTSSELRCPPPAPLGYLTDSQFNSHARCKQNENEKSRGWGAAGVERKQFWVFFSCFSLFCAVLVSSRNFYKFAFHCIQVLRRWVTSQGMFSIISGLVPMF